jgi:ribosomal protein L7/L12
MSDYKSHRDVVKEIFMRDAKAFVVANKYMVDGMAGLAAERIKNQMQETTTTAVCSSSLW